MPEPSPLDDMSRPTAAGSARRAPEVAVLGSKLAPPPFGSPPVMRRRVLDLLSAGASRSSVTLVSGPAGSGKSVLAASWMHAQADSMSVGWLTLDESDDDPATFWTYVVTALRRVGVECPDDERLVPGERLPTSFVPRLASGVLARDRPVVLIIDNADCLTGREVTEALDLLLRQAGRRLHLVLCARADPQLPLHQYRLAGTITEIRSDRLSFTAEETRELIERLGTPVSAAVAEELRARTEGWAVGLRLAVAPLQQGVDPLELVASLAEEDGSVAQYLFEEVLKDQPASVRHFLLRISVSDELWPDLLDRLAGRANARRTLAALAHANAFVEQAPGAPGGYRIHPLFRDMLAAQLAYDHPREVSALHRVCAAWYADAGRLREAAGHAVAGRDWSTAMALLVDDLVVGRMLAHEGGLAAGLLDALPSSLAGPEATVLRAAADLAQGRAPRQEDVSAVAAAAHDPASRLTLRVSAAVTYVAAVARAHRGDGVAARAADGTLALVGTLPDGSRADRRNLRAVVTAARATALLDSDAADHELLEALRAAGAAGQAAGSRQLRCRALGELALLEALQGQLRTATQLARECEKLSDEMGARTGRRSSASATATAWVCAERYEHADARRWMLRARERGSEESEHTAAVLAVLHSRVLRLRREFDAAEQSLDRCGDSRRLPRWVREQVVAEAIRTRFARNELADGLQRLAELDGTPRAAVLRATAGLLGAPVPPEPAPPGGDLPLVLAVERDVLRACRAWDAGGGPGAGAALHHALELAEPERLRAPFLEAPPHVRRLLRTQPQLGSVGAWLDPSSGTARSAPSAAARPGARGDEPPVEVPQALSERELEVLQLLAEMMSTAEIAAAMFISANTVRTHIRSILRKLSVSRRSHAVRRARELTII